MSIKAAAYPPLISYISTVTVISFTPTSVTGCAVWFDGADPAGTGVVPANGATVSTWVDKSGNGYNATVASGKVAGTYSSSNKAINFATSSTGYVTSYPANPTAETMFVVFNNPSPSGNNNMVIGGQQGARSLGGGYSGSGGTGVVGVLNNEVVWLAATPASSYTSGTTVLITCKFSSTYNYISMNGGTFNTGGSPGFYASTTTYLGVDTTTTIYYYVGYEMEILFYNSILSTSDQQKVEGYLAWKWGIQASLPVGHPYASVNPNSIITTYTSTINTIGYTRSISTLLTTTTFSPLSITGCQLWFDGADPAGTGTLPSNGAALSTWADKSGNSKNATGVNSPTYVLSSKSVSFVSASSQYFTLPDACLPYNNSSYSYFIVANVNNSSQNCGFIGGGNWGSDGQVFAFRTFPDMGTGLLNYWWGNDLLTGNNYTLNTTFIAECFYAAGGNRDIWVNGTRSGQDTPGTRNQGSGNNRIGQTYSGEYMSGTISEILVYNVRLTTTQQQQVEGYLAWKWGFQASLSNGHPYASVNPGGTASTLSTLYIAKTASAPFTTLAYYTAFNPRSLSTLALWIDGADPLGTGVAPTQGTLLSSLKDKSSNAYPISTFSTTVGFPSYTTAANGSLGALQLTAGNGIQISSFSLSPSMSLFLVYSPLATGRGISFEQGVNALSNSGFLLTSVSSLSTLYTIGAPSGLTATGGTMTTSGSFKYHLFTTSGTFTVSSGSSIVYYLIVGGGGGGGGRHGGGGGAGGVLSGSWTPTATSYTITVGAGGVNGLYGTNSPSGAGYKGGDSSISTVATAYGGGGGGTYDGNPTDTLIGSGGGGGGNGLAGVAGTAGQGNAGGSGLQPGGGGGGGAGGAGVNANTSTGGAGTSAYSARLLAVGYGTTFAVGTSPNTVISGGLAYIAAGGGGASSSGSAGGLGGVGGGGQGEWMDTTYLTAGTASTGSGGGGNRSARGTEPGAAGGSGLVLLWYSFSQPQLQSQVFLPTSISGMQLWYDAADPAGTGIAPSIGTTVTSWKDKSGNANHATGQVSAVTGSDSTGSYLNFTGSTYYTIGSGAFIANQYFTIFIVERLQGNSSGEQHMIGNTSGGNNAALHIRYVNTTSIRFAFYYNDLDVSNITGYTSADAQPTRILTFSQLPNSRTVYLNSSNIGSDTNNTLLSSWSQPLIGQSFGSSYYTGRIREIIFYTGQLIPIQRQAVEGYLAWKWGLQTSLPTTHPYYTAAPSSSILLNGLILWVDGQDNTKISLSGSTVTSVTDKASGLTLTASGTTSYLTVAAASINSYQSLWFNNASSANVYLSATFQSILTGCVFIVWKSLAQSAVDWRPIFTWNSGGQYPAYGYLGGTTTLTVGPYTAYNSPNGTPTLVTTANTVYLTFYSWSGTTPTVGQNGATPTTGTQAAFSSSTTTFWLGADGGGAASRTNMYLGEIIMYNSVLGTVARQQMEGYLAWKWGLQTTLPTTHPYYTAAPSNTIISNGIVYYFDANLLLPTTSTWTDLGGTGNLTLYNTPTVVSGSVSYVRFDGSTQYGGSVNMTNLTAFTITMWIRTSSTADNSTYYLKSYLIGQDSAGNASQDFGVTIGGGYAGFWSGIGSTDTYNQAQVNTSAANYVANGAWHEVTITSSYSSGTLLYVDGAVFGSSLAASQVTQSGQNWFIAAANRSYGAGAGSFCAVDISLIALYNRQLSASEVAANFRSKRSVFGV